MRRVYAYRHRANIISILHQNCTVHTDDRGVMLSDLAAAHRCAVSVIWNYMRLDTEEQDWRGWRVKIADDTGRTLVIVLFPTARSRTFDPHHASS